jgi:hypothetical protein
MAFERLRRRLERARALPMELARTPAAVAATNERLDAELARLFEILNVIYDDEPGNRRRLAALRASDAYEQAFEDEEPLVSIVIPTYTNYETLRERALPSVLGQTYEHIEVVVVGDHAPDETAEVVAGFRDPRLVYDNLPYRGPYPADPFDRWNVSGVPAYNAAVRRARGRWISPFSDDDALRPDAIQTVVREAQDHRHEVVYGIVNCVLADGREEPLGVFPPARAGFGFQGAIYHSGLRFIEHELADALFRIPHDWGMARRMIRIGVRFGFTPRVLCDYFPTSNPRGDVDPALFERLHADRAEGAAYDY